MIIIDSLKRTMSTQIVRGALLFVFLCLIVYCGALWLDEVLYCTTIISNTKVQESDTNLEPVKRVMDNGSILLLSGDKLEEDVPYIYVAYNVQSYYKSGEGVTIPVRFSAYAMSVLSFVLVNFIISICVRYLLGLSTNRVQLTGLSILYGLLVMLEISVVSIYIIGFNWGTAQTCAFIAGLIFTSILKSMFVWGKRSSSGLFKPIRTKG